MRLISLNTLCCRVKGCPGGEASLDFEASKIEETQKEYNPTATRKLTAMMDWALLESLAKKLGVIGFPAHKPADLSEDLLKTIHRLLFEADILDGKLWCKSCQRAYPIVDGIPNLILDDKEI